MVFRPLALASALWLAGCTTVSLDTPDPSNVMNGSDPHIYIAGDSTAADYPAERAPQIGWGQTLPYFLKSPDLVRNLAVNGRSTRSYFDEGRWAALMESVEANDVVLISFGHNDSRDDAPERYAEANTDFRNYLNQFAQDVQSKGAFPVIVSSAARRLWEGPAMVETHGLYRENAKLAAEESDATYIDFAQSSLEYFEALGQSETKQDYLWLEPDPDHIRFPDGVEDNTHFTELGACGLSYVLAKQFLEISELEPFINKSRLGEPVLASNGTRPDAVMDCERWVKARR